jgi:O-acetyl-ADP-ribose deacetylase (regulator of RNase III)
MAKISHKRGDATAPEGVGPKVIVHICNDIGAWGKGFVMALSRRWPAPEAEYRKWHRGVKGFKLGNVRLVKVDDDLWVANMIAQKGIRRKKGNVPLRYSALEKSLGKVAEFAEAHQAQVVMPKIGCGLAGGKWERVREIVQTELVDKGIDVTVYSL